MNCLQDADSRLMADIARRVASMEKVLAPFSAMVGVDQTPEQSIVPVISVVQVVAGSSQFFTLVWQSTPGEQFSVQTSQDGLTWGSVYSPFPAAPSPSTVTTWTSGGFLIDDLPRYFRVRRYPVAFTPCDGGRVFCVLPTVGTNPPPEGSHYLTPDGGVYMTPNGGIYLTPS